MSLAVIKMDGKFMGSEIEEGQYYSTLTGSDPSSFARVWQVLDNFLGENSSYRLTIFKSERAAKLYSDRIVGKNKEVVAIEELFKFLKD